MRSGLSLLYTAQAVRDAETKEVLFCTAYLFESTRAGAGPSHLVYRLVDELADGALGRRFTS